MSSVSDESILAGLLLKLEVIDNIDFNLIIEEFKKKTKVYIFGEYDDIARYVICEENGTISLKSVITLDYFIKDENQTLRDKLKQVAGNTVLEYLDNLDVEKYKIEKEQVLTDYKERVLKGANILLISDIQDDYDELIKYGFKNVDYFKSIIRADSYFAKHPEELEKYHMILKGNQNVQHCCFDGQVELDRTIDRLRDKKYILAPSLYRYNYPDYMELVTYLGDRNNRRSWVATERTYKDIFDRIVENMLINHILETVDLKGKKFSFIQDKINPNRLPLPMKKSDLKILYLDSISVSEYAEKIANMLGLNITFKEDNNRSLGRYVKSNLGEYDIIIVSRYSSNLLGMNVESTEQCKDTGRELTLLVSYDHVYCSVDSDLGNEIKLNYKFGGNVAPNFDFYSKKFGILKQPIELEGKGEDLKKYRQSEYSQMRAIIEASVNLYNEALIQVGKNSISDLDLNSAEEFNKEYLSVIESKRKREAEERATIRLFGNIKYSILRYLNYKKQGFIMQEPEGLKISEVEDKVKVESIYQGRTLCAIIFSKNYKKGYSRIFEIQTLSKKGILSSPQKVAIYISDYVNLEELPEGLNEKQLNALISIGKKVNVVLNPLNEQAYQQAPKKPQLSALNVKRKVKKLKYC